MGLAVGAAIGALFLWIAFRQADLAQVVQALRHGDWTLPAFGLLVGTLLYVTSKAVRWRWLLGGAPEVRLRDLLKPTVAGLALNALLPHAGEFVRAASLQRRHGYVTAAVLASIVAERVFDLVAVLLLGATALSTVAVPGPMVAALRVMAWLAALGAALMVALWLRPAPFRKGIRQCTRPLPARWQERVLDEFDAAVGAFGVVRSPRTAAVVLLWSLFQWLAIALCAGCAARVVGVPVGASAALLVVEGIVVAFLLPNAPGYAGSVQLAFVMSLGASGVAPVPALAASVVYQALMIGPVVIVGLAVLPASLRRDPAP